MESGEWRVESGEWRVESEELLNRHVKHLVDVGVAVLDVQPGHKVLVALKTLHSSLFTLPNHLSPITVRVA